MPNLLAEGLDPKCAFVPILYEIIPKLDGIIGESERNTRRYLKLFTENFRDIPICLLNEHTKDMHELLQPLIRGENWGLVSDCGLPCLADPGARLVAVARKKNIPIQAYPGPSSIIQALMLSGLSGQSFAFHGYLPRDESRRISKIKELVSNVVKERQTQIFIEAPYRNNPMRDSLIEHVPKNIAVLAVYDVMFDTQSVVDVRSCPDLHKKPCVFLIG